MGATQADRSPLLQQAAYRLLRPDAAAPSLAGGAPSSAGAPSNQECAMSCRMVGRFWGSFSRACTQSGGHREGGREGGDWQAF